MPVRVRRDFVWLAVSVAALLAYWFVGVLGRVEPAVNFGGGDLLFQFRPDYLYLAARMRAGELALWNPWQGQPFLATLLPGTLYPARLLLLVLAPETAMHVSTVTHLALSFAGTFLLCRALGSERLGASLGGVVYVGIHALPTIYWPPFVEGGAWMPFAALALVRLVATGSWSWTIALGLTTGLIVLAGCYQHAVYAVYALGVIGLGLLAEPARRGCLSTPTGIVRLAAAGLLAAATAAPQALPTLAWSALSVRSGMPLTDAQLDVFPWPWVIWNHMFASWGADSLVLVSVPVALLAVLGCLVSRRFGAVLLTASVASVVLCLGRGAPGFALFRVLPGFSSFRLPERLLFLVAFFLAIGAALGVDRLARGRALAKTLAAVACVAVVVSLLGPRRISSALPWTLPSDRLTGPPALMSLVARFTGGGRTLLTGAGFDDGIAVKQPGMHRVRSLQDYNSLTSHRLASYLYAIVGRPPPKPEAPKLFLGFLQMNERIVRPELLDMAAVRTVLIKAFVPMPRRQPPFQRVGGAARWALYLNPRAFPRAYTIERARFVRDDVAALAMVRSPTFEARNEVVLVVARPVSEQAALRAGPAGSLREARIVRDEPEHVVVEARSERSAVVVLTDPIAPGWSATIDGEPAPVLAANHLGRGVVVPAGEHRVEFVYRAPWLRSGLAIFVVVWAAVGAIAVTSRAPWWLRRLRT